MKPNLLLLHGALGSKNQFNKLAPLLSERLNVHAFDFSGHGNQFSDQPFSMELFVEDIIEFMNENLIEKCCVFGYSMGGYAALKAASLYPQRFEKVLSLGTKLDWNRAFTDKETAKLNPTALLEKVPQFVAKLKQEHPATDWQLLLEKTADMMQGLAGGEGLNQSDYKKITCEVVLAVGTDDKMVTLEETQELVDSLPRAKLAQLDGVPHLIEKADVLVLQKHLFSNLISELT